METSNSLRTGAVARMALGQAFLALLWMLPAGALVADDERLVSIHEEILEDYPDVPHIDGDGLQQALADKEDVLLFDVREAGEFDVSHLDGAIRIDPEIEGMEFLYRFGGTLEGKTAIFYCSVGRRSSEVAQRIMDVAPADRHLDLYNLEHGVFGWHNESRPLSSKGVHTEFVHPYNWWWGRLVERRDRIRYRTE